MKKNNPENLKRLILAQAGIVFKKQISSQPFRNEGAYESLWEIQVVRTATSQFRRLHGVNTILGEDLRVIQQVVEKFKPNWIAELKAQHQSNKESYWRLRKFEEKEERNPRGNNGNTR